MRTSEILEKAWSLIDQPKKWIRGNWHQEECDDDGVIIGHRYCSIGALQMATLEHVNEHLDITDAPPAYIAAHAVLAESLPKRAQAEGIEDYNDTREYHTIRKFWQKAIRRAKVLEGEIIELPEVAPVLETEETERVPELVA